MLTPEYDEVLIIGEQKAGKFTWYCVPKEKVYKILTTGLNFSGYSAATAEIRALYNSPNADKISFQPSIYINWDKKSVYSQFPEPASFEDLVPEPWEGHYYDFTGFIPQKEKYWLN